MKPEISPEDVTNMRVFMTRHVGSNNRVSPERLAEYLYGKPTANNIRRARAVRRLTPTECERLQGFHDGWTAGQPDSARYKQLGNAVAVPVAEWIGKRIMEMK